MASQVGKANQSGLKRAFSNDTGPGNFIMSLWRWKTSLEVYLRTFLTEEGNRFVALSGMAKFFGEKSQLYLPCWIMVKRPLPRAFVASLEAKGP